MVWLKDWAHLYMKSVKKTWKLDLLAEGERQREHVIYLTRDLANGLSTVFYPAAIANTTRTVKLLFD